jgi:hypothetical protein
MEDADTGIDEGLVLSRFLVGVLSAAAVTPCFPRRRT